MIERMFDTVLGVAAVGDREFSEWSDPGPAPVVALPRIPASAGLAMELEFGVEPIQGLDDAALDDVITSYARMAGWAQANQSRALAELARRAEADPRRRGFVVDEIATSLHLSGGVAGTHLTRAVALDSHLAATREAWELGLLDERRVGVIVDGTRHLDADVAVSVEARVLSRAPEQTAARLRAAVKRAVIAADPAGAQERHERARAERRVSLYPEAEGMVTLAATMTAADGVACEQWLTSLARGLGSDDPRTMDARRSDLLVGLVTGWIVAGEPSGDVQVVRPVTPGKPLVQVTMDLDTLRGQGEHPADLAGYGPITADAARMIAADAVWVRLVTDPLSGALLDHGRTRYQPPAALADFVRARDVTCMFPGCSRTAASCEIDHTVPFPHGPTSDSNLHSLCVRHHHLKHEGDWTVVALSDGGLEWTNPTGHAHVVQPRDYRPEPPVSAPIQDDDEPPPF